MCGRPHNVLRYWRFGVNVLDWPARLRPRLVRPMDSAGRDDLRSVKQMRVQHDLYPRKRDRVYIVDMPAILRPSPQPRGLMTPFPALRRYLVAATFLFLPILAPACAGSDATALIGVTLVDPATGTSRPAQTVLFAGDSILAVGDQDAVEIPRGSTRVRADGKFLIPGLWDMHTHLSMIGRGAFPLLLANGVTGVRDMGGDLVVLAWRDSVRAGTLTGPRIRSAGLIVESARWLAAVLEITRPLGRPDLEAELERRLAIDTPEDAERVVDTLAKLGVDFIKIRNYPSPAAYYLLARRARERGLAIAGHAPPPGFIRALSDSGFASLEHSVLDFRNGTLVEGFSVMETEQRRDLFAALARNGTAFDPTLASGAARLVADSTVERMIADTAGASDPRLRYLPSRLREEWRSQLALKRADPSPVPDWAAIHQASAAMTREMAAAGVSIVAGTDLSVPPLIPGFAVGDELELLVRDAGLSPAEALRAATIHAATVLGLAKRSGLVEAGRFADLVLLDANPLEDIGAVRRVSAVVVAGRYFDRAALDRLLAQGFPN
jgi:imidazolonepropionase-like amidohydrolase